MASIALLQNKHIEYIDGYLFENKNIKELIILAPDKMSLCKRGDILIHNMSPKIKTMYFDIHSFYWGSREDISAIQKCCKLPYGIKFKKIYIVQNTMEADNVDWATWYQSNIAHIDSSGMPNFARKHKRIEADPYWRFHRD